MVDTSSTNKASNLMGSTPRSSSFFKDRNCDEDLELQHRESNSEFGEQTVSSVFSDPDDVVDENNDNEKKKEDDDKLMNPPMREVKFSGGIFAKQHLAFNPLTSFIGFAALWGAAIWCMVSNNQLPYFYKSHLIEAAPNSFCFHSVLCTALLSPPNKKNFRPIDGSIWCSRRFGRH